MCQFVSGAVNRDSLDAKRVKDENRKRSASTDASNPTSVLYRNWLSVIMSSLEDGIQLSLIHDI